MKTVLRSRSLPRRCGQDRLQHDLLLVEEHVAGLLPDHLRGVLEQLAVGPVAALADGAQHAEPVAAAEPVVEEGDELVEAVAGEQRVDAEQVGVAAVVELRAVVVRAGRAGTRRRRAGSPRRGTRCGCRRGTAGTGRLRGGVQLVADPTAVDDPDAVGDLGDLGVVPLLELDQHRARRPSWSWPVISASMRRELSGSWNSRKMPWSRKPPWRRAFASALSELRHERSSRLGTGS
jgi:hypothetical protein